VGAGQFRAAPDTLWYTGRMLRAGFRNLEPIRLWSGKLRPDIDLADFRRSVGALSAELNESFSGFITQDNEGRVRTFTRTRYPRKKYGIPEIEQITASTDTLAKKLGREVTDETRVPKEIFRVVLGLLEGYDKSSDLHTIEEVRERLGGTSLRAMLAEVFAVRPNMVGSSDIYIEPCAVITGRSKEVETVYDLADIFRQQRFTVEDFSERAAWVVETPHCSTPDLE